jgi:nucleotide-binding universal stress UspA family protein
MAYPYRSILIPIALDDPSLVALGLAKQMARDQGATMHLLHVATKLPSFGEPEFSEDEHSPGEERARAMLRQIAAQQLTSVRHEIHTASAAMRVMAKAVVKVAGEVKADVIILKINGRKGLSAQEEEAAQLSSGEGLASKN